MLKKNALPNRSGNAAASPGLTDLALTCVGAAALNHEMAKNRVAGTGKLAAPDRGLILNLCDTFVTFLSTIFSLMM